MFNRIHRRLQLGRISVMLEKHKRQSHCSKPESEMQYVYVVLAKPKVPISGCVVYESLQKKRVEY